MCEVALNAITATAKNRLAHATEGVQKIYPDGIHAVIADHLSEQGFAVRTATQDEPEHGLTEAVLAETDVLTWWGHIAHDQVSDEIVDRVHERVNAGGMGLIALHSAHYSKIFKKLMGTSCMLKTREADEKERLWVIEQGHPIARGLPEYFEIPQTEMYGEPFDVPAPGYTGVHELVPGWRGLPQRLLLSPRARQSLLLPARPRNPADLLSARGIAGYQLTPCAGLRHPAVPN